MNLSPGPTPWCPSTTSSAASASRQLSLDPALHSLGERVARPLHPRQVDQDHLPARGPVGGDAANRPAGGLRTVGDDRHLGAHDRVDQRRLADVRPPGQPDEPRPGHRRSSPAGPSACITARPREPASPPRRLRGRSRRGGERRGPSPDCRSAACSGQMTTSPSSRGPATPSAPSIGNESTSVGSSRPRCSRFSSRIRSGGDQLHREVPLEHPRRPQGGPGRRPQLPGNVRQVQGRRGQAFLRLSRSYSP